MLQATDREVVRFDLTFDTNPSGLTVPMTEIGTYLLDRVQAGLAVSAIEAERYLLLIADGRMVALPSGARALSLLFHLGDPDASDASVIHLKKRTLRHFQKEEEEGRAVSAHLLLCLEPATPRGRIYRALLEKVVGLGQSRVKPELQRQLRQVFRDKEIPVTDIDGNERKAIPRVELQPVASERLKAELQDGTKIGTVRLVNSRIEDGGFDPPAFAEIKRREMALKVDVPLGMKAEEALRALQLFARENRFDEMYVQWERPKPASADERVMPNRAKIDVMNDDIGETLFAQRHIIKLAERMNDCVPALRDDMIDAMAALLDQAQRG